MYSQKEIDIQNRIQKLTLNEQLEKQQNQDESEKSVNLTQKTNNTLQPVVNNIQVPYKLLTGHWLTISRPQYQRTCGISSLVSLWNFQFSKLGLGNKQPISIEQAMLKLNLIGNGSIQENMRKKFKKTAELTQKPDQTNKDIINNEASINKIQEKTLQQQKQQQQIQIRNSKMSLHQYINTVDFGCFTGNDTLLKWYRLLCRIYGGSGRSYLFYKTNSQRSVYKTQQNAKKALIQGLNSNGKTCFIYHAYDHYFCPVGYEFVPKQQQNASGTFNLSELSQKQSGDNLYIMIGQSSKMFANMHVVKWNQIQLDLQTYWPKFFNIRRKKQGVQYHKGKQNQKSRIDTIDCIMAFQKIRD